MTFGIQIFKMNTPRLIFCILFLCDYDVLQTEATAIFSDSFSIYLLVLPYLIDFINCDFLSIIFECQFVDLPALFYIHTGIYNDEER